jgi:transposase, IS605 OrfB family, central region
MPTKTIEKTIKLKLIPLTKNGRNQLYSLLEEYTIMIREAIDIIIENDARSRKRAHELCYTYLRERHPQLHSKFTQEAYKRALAMYRSYRKLLNKWKRLPEEKRKKVSPPSPPSVEDNRVVELHIETYKLERRHGFLTLTISKGNGVYLKFLVMEYEHAKKELEDAKLSNSKLLVDNNSIFLLLTLRRDVEVIEHKNKLVVDINEDSFDCLLVDYDKSKAVFFSVKHDIRAIRTNYRRIRKRIQEKVENLTPRNKLLEKYGFRERKRVEDRLKKITTLLAEIAREHNADLVRENLRDLKLKSKKKSKQLNYRLSTLPYRKFIGYIDYKFYERGLSVVEADAKKTSISCPVCGYSDRKNRASKETFECRKCGFKFNVQYVACLNLFSRSNDGFVTIRSGSITLISRKAGSVVPVDVAPNEPLIEMKWLREKPVQVSKVILVTKR